jgi:WbqC-like protein family
VEHPRIALMQPAFLPWQGFFGLVAAADVFVLLDDFQFQRPSP